MTASGRGIGPARRALSPARPSSAEPPMPVLSLRTNLPLPAGIGLCHALTAAVSALTGKPTSTILIELSGGLTMTLGGDDAPCALLDVRSIGADPALALRLSDALCALLHEALGLPPDRVYIEVHSPRGALFGWNHQTFAHLDG